MKCFWFVWKLCPLYAPLYIILSQNFLFLEYAGTAESRRCNFCVFFSLSFFRFFFLCQPFAYADSFLVKYHIKSRDKGEQSRFSLFFWPSENFPDKQKFRKVEKQNKKNAEHKTAPPINYEHNEHLQFNVNECGVHHCIFSISLAYLFCIERSTV